MVVITFTAEPWNNATPIYVISKVNKMMMSWVRRSKRGCLREIILPLESIFYSTNSWNASCINPMNQKYAVF